MDRQREGNLKGKIVIITGASRGLGKQAALDFAKRGASVVLAARTVETDSKLPGSLSETLAQIKDMGASAIAVQTDLADPNDLKRLVDETVREFGGIDVLVNNAAATTGDAWTKGFIGATVEEWLYQFQVNLHAPYILMQHVTPHMDKRGGGRILNVTTSSAEVFRMAEQPILPQIMNGKRVSVHGYFASKHALDRLGSIIASELIEKNIYVIGLHPGWVGTEVVEARLESVPDEERDGREPIPVSVPSRMLCYFAACADPAEYTGRLFWAERELADLGIWTEQWKNRTFVR